MDIRRPPQRPLRRHLARAFMPAILALGALCLSPPSLAAQWSVGAGGSELRLEGVIEPGDAMRLEALIASGRARPGAHIILSSRGGDVDEGMRIGRAIRPLRATLSHGYCASSCALVFIAGTTRLLGRAPSSLVIHQPSAAAALLASSSPSAAAMLQGLRSYCRSMTGADGFYDAMMATPFASPRALGLAEAISMGAADSAAR